MIMSRHGSLGFGRGLALGAGSEHSYSGLGIGSDPEREVKVSRGKRPGAYTPPPPPSSAWSPGTILAKMFEQVKGNDVERAIFSAVIGNQLILIQPLFKEKAKLA